MGDTVTRIFLILSDIFISNFTSKVMNQKYFKTSIPLFHLIRFTTKIIELYNSKFPKNILSKDGVSKKFLESDSNGTSSKNKYFKHMNFFKQLDPNPQPPSSYVFVFVYELSGYGFKSRCCRLNFRYGACIE